jgi:Ca-activated chloride channel family protein
LKIHLRPLIVAAKNLVSHLNNFVKQSGNNYLDWTIDNESYTTFVENLFVKTSPPYPITFASNTNQASYSNIRRFLSTGEKVLPDAVRVEEMLNYFNFNYSEPGNGNLFKETLCYSNCPWNDAHTLLLLNICARKINMGDIPPINLVFLIDASGSMDLPNKLPLIKSCLKLLIKDLRPVDTVSIVAYGGGVRTVIEGISGQAKEKITTAVENLNADGDTPGEEGIRLT